MTAKRSTGRARLTMACALGVALFVASAAPSPVHADARRREYLARLDLVLDGLVRTMHWVERYRGTSSAVRFAHPLVERYVEMAGRMTPSPDLVALHPHLILIAENVERAVAAAENDDMSMYRQRVRTVRLEMRTLETILAQLEVRLPSMSR